MLHHDQPERVAALIEAFFAGSEDDSLPPTPTLPRKRGRE
jgi:hypothetical protein